MLLFNLTPILRRRRGSSNFRWVYGNPMALLIDAHRAVLLRGELPSAASMLGLLLLTTLLFQVGYTVFKRATQRLVEEL